MNRSRATNEANGWAGGTFVVGHPRRHHLFQTAMAYLEAGALARWVTEVFVGDGPGAGLLRAARQFSPRARKLCNYSCASLNEHALVAQPSLPARLAFRLLGTPATPRTWAEAVVYEAEAAEAAVHLPCVHAAAVFERLRPRRRRLVLEQYIADRRQGRDLLLQESDALGVYDIGLLDSQGFAADRISLNEAEYALADTIIVGSEFVRGTLLAHGVPAAKVVVAEYGVDLELWPYHERHRAADLPLQVAFIGSGALRKGLLRLLRAARSAGRVHLHVFGNVSDLPGGAGSWESVAEFHGHVPQADLRHMLARCHAFALPSLWEGSALVVAEAMASGLPVVVTPNAGSWARDGVDGRTVPLGDEAALALALQELLDEDRRVEMGRNARKNAERHSWDFYRERVRLGVLNEATAP